MKDIKVERSFGDFLVRTGRGNCVFVGNPDKDFAVVKMPDNEAELLLRVGGIYAEVKSEEDINNNEQTV